MKVAKWLYVATAKKSKQQPLQGTQEGINNANLIDELTAKENKRLKKLEVIAARLKR